MDFGKKELETAEWLDKTFNGLVSLVPRVSVDGQGIKTNDFIFKG